MERSTSDSTAVPLSELRGKQLAVCSEKAAVAQNLLALLGAEAVLIHSDQCRLPSEEREALHAYNLLRTSRGTFLYDPTNPKLFLDHERHLVNLAPALSPLNQEQVALLQHGGVITVPHDDLIEQLNGTWQLEQSERIYGGAAA